MPNSGALERDAGFVILVAEDNDDDVHFLSRAFAKAGLSRSAVFVRDGEEVIKYLMHQPPFDDPALCPKPTLLLLDARMPKIDGAEVLLWLQRHPELSPLPVLVCTSSLTPGQRDHALKLGAGACLQKPFALEEWEAMVEQLKTLASLTRRNQTPAPLTK